MARVLLLISWALVVGTSHVAPAAADEAPGLAQTIQPLDGKPSDTREVRMVALHVPAGAAPSSFVAPGRFRATWEGNLNLKLRERYAFGAEGRGKLTVRIDDKTVFESSGEDLSKKAGEPVRLKKGANKVVAVYESPEAGDAVVRLLWSKPGTPAQPPSPSVFTHDPNVEATARGRTLREGRERVAQFRCTKCHAAPTDGAYPELTMDAPSFAEIGSRLNEDWMAAWLKDPRSIRPDAHMPKMFHAGNKPDVPTPDGEDVRAVDVAAYLKSLGSPLKTAIPTSGSKKQVAAGRRLYDALACVACHVAPDAKPSAATAQPARVSHAHVATKFTPAGLKEYLLKPDAHYAWNPMPDFRLSDQEADALAAYLLGADEPKPSRESTGPMRGVAERGAPVVASAGCVACHGGTKQANTLHATRFAELGKGAAGKRGCLAESEASCGAAPWFGLSPKQRDAIVAFITTDQSALTRDDPAEFAHRQYTVMRCGNCHTRDGVEPALLTALAGEFNPKVDAGELENGVHLSPDQTTFPSLTWIGEKLRPEWASDFMGGAITYKPRPYLRARMPAFKLRAEGLATGFAAQHGLAARGDANPAHDEKLATIGTKLLGTVGGFSCVQCHAVNGAAPLGAFEAPGIDLGLVSRRLRKDFYHRWVMDPMSLEPTTKMPRYADDEGKTALRDVFGGDATQQFEAIWQSLLLGKALKRPE